MSQPNPQVDEKAAWRRVERFCRPDDPNRVTGRRIDPRDYQGPWRRCKSWRLVGLDKKLERAEAARVTARVKRLLNPKTRSYRAYNFYTHKRDKELREIGREYLELGGKKEPSRFQGV
jgi:hypothetical protein